MPAADRKAFAVQRRYDAVRDDVFDFCMAFGMLEPFIFGGLYDRTGDGVGKVFFQTGGRREHIIFALFAEYDDA